MKNKYIKAKRIGKKALLTGLATLMIGGCSSEFDRAVERQATRDYAKKYMGYVMRDIGYRVYGQRNGARVATKDYENGFQMDIDANGNGFYEKTLYIGFGQKPRIEMNAPESNDGTTGGYGFPK